jgi:hypothetical protein
MRGSLSFIAGALLSSFNYLMTMWSVKALVKSADRDGKGPSRFFFALKYPVLLALIGLILFKTPVQAGAFVAGFLSVLFVLVLKSLKKRED